MDVLPVYLEHSPKVSSRDKVFRLVQYISKLIGYYVQDPEMAKRLKQLESILSSSRKTFRLGKTVEMLNSASQALSKPDPILRNILVCAYLSYAVHLAYDTLTWCVKAGVLKPADPKAWSRKADQFWCLGLNCNLIRVAYEVSAFYKQDRKDGGGEKKTSLVEFVYNKPAIVVDMAKNLADLVSALESLEKITITSRTAGVCGIISSALGLLQVLAPRYKL